MGGGGVGETREWSLWECATKSHEDVTRRRLRGTGSRPSPDTESAGTLVPHTQPPKPGETYICCFSPPAHDILLQRPQTAVKGLHTPRQCPVPWMGEWTHRSWQIHTADHTGHPRYERQLDGSQQPTCQGKEARQESLRPECCHL